MSRRSVSERGGSSLQTSMAAPATWPLSSAASRSASTTIPPRAQLTTRAPGRSSASSRAPAMPSVSGVSGTWKVTTSASRSSASKSGTSRAPTSRARASGM